MLYYDVILSFLVNMYIVLSVSSTPAHIVLYVNYRGHSREMLTHTDGKPSFIIKHKIKLKFDLFDLRNEQTSTG